tara:strand:- start:249 stop:638 length:390 start_codon:yes stop_codon:yes gene_type:complete
MAYFLSRVFIPEIYDYIMQFVFDNYLEEKTIVHTWNFEYIINKHFDSYNKYKNTEYWIDSNHWDIDIDYIFRNIQKIYNQYLTPYNRSISSHYKLMLVNWLGIFDTSVVNRTIFPHLVAKLTIIKQLIK